jgi:hypothetical protein
MSRKRKNKIDFTFLVAAIILVISLVLFLIALNINYFLILDKVEFPVKVKIDNYNAFNITENDPSINLGSVSKGSGAGPRNIDMSNDYAFPTQLILDCKGEICDLLVFDRSIVLNAQENAKIPIQTKIIEDEEYGLYEGIIVIKIRKYVG